MSWKAVRAVFESPRHFGPHRRAVLVALADYADDAGENVRPSMARLAEKTEYSVDQVRRHVRQLELHGVIELVNSGLGGHPGDPRSARRYRIRLDRLAVPDDPTPRTDATPCMDAVHPLRGCSSHLAPTQAKPIKNRNEPLIIPATPDAEASVQHQPLGADNPREAIWRVGVDLLTSRGSTEASARAFLGRHAKQGEKKLAETIGFLAINPMADPRSYIAAAMKPKQREFVG